MQSAIIKTGMESRELGKEGERKASEILEEKGYRIVELNWRKPFGEIDIVAKAGDKTLVFVEVKTMRNFSEGIRPEDQMSPSKLIKFHRASEAYARLHPELVDECRGWRCDCICLTRIGNDWLEHHYENV
jgi:putative endonuclease